jgi:hypothetical protein
MKSGFRKGERVLTPSGHLATVVKTRNQANATAQVRFDDPAKANRTFRQAALRLAERRESN